MITTHVYIDYQLDTEKMQADFDKAIARAIRIIRNEPNDFVRISIVSGGEDSAITDLAQVYVKANDKEANIWYEKDNLTKFNLAEAKDIYEYVYLVSINQMWDGSEISNKKKIFATFEDALGYFKAFTKDEKESIDNSKDKPSSDSWELSEDEYDDIYREWEYYVDGDAMSWHTYVHLTKEPIFISNNL